MHIWLIVTGIVMVGVLAIMSVVLLSGHGGSLISGYNCLSEEAKQRYDEKKLCRAMGIMLSVITVATAGLFICLSLDIYILICAIIYTIITLISVIVGIYYTNNKCFKINGDSDVVVGLKEISCSPDYIKQKRKKMALLIGSLAFSIIVVAVVFFTIIRLARPTVYIIKDGTLQISTAFGESVSLSEIEKVELKNTMPDNLSKVNGLDLDTVLKGKFKTDSDTIHVYVDTSKPPFIYIYTKDGLTIINNQTKNDTQSLYEKLKTGK